MDAMPLLRESPAGILLEVYVQPRASRNEIVGAHESRLKVRLKAPPVDGEANRECIRFLADFFNAPKTDVEIVQGLTSRRKTVSIRNIPLDDAQSALKKFL